MACAMPLPASILACAYVSLKHAAKAGHNCMTLAICPKVTFALVLEVTAAACASARAFWLAAKACPFSISC